MIRRRFLETAGTVTLGGLFASGTVSATEGGSKPNGNVDVDEVSVFSTEGEPTDVDAGDWIEHRIGWIADTEADVQRWLDTVEPTMTIDGEEVENVFRYFGDIEPAGEENEDAVVWWEYYTPPKTPGMHTFSAEFYYPERYDGGLGSPREAGTRNTFTGYYAVSGDEE